MSHFSFEQQLSEAVRMDQSLHLNPVFRQSLKPPSRLRWDSDQYFPFHREGFFTRYTSVTIYVV